MILHQVPNHQHSAIAACNAIQLICLDCLQCHRLFDHDVLAGFKNSLCKHEMRRRNTGNDNSLGRRVIEQIVE